jgi:hypothetical protein
MIKYYKELGMKPSEEIKQKYGFTTMKEVSDKSGEHSNNLISWHKLYPRRFELVMKGLVFERVLRQMQEVESCHDDQ